MIIIATNRYRKNRWTQQKLFIICYTMQLVSTQQWGHHQAKNKKLGTWNVHGSSLRDPVRFTLISISISISISLYQMRNGLVCRKLHIHQSVDRRLVNCCEGAAVCDVEQLRLVCCKGMLRTYRVFTIEWCDFKN
jgi:hypothetical protein